MKKILIINNSSKISGAEISLLSILETLDANKYSIILAIPKGDFYDELVLKYNVKVFNLKRFSGSYNFLELILYLFNILFTSLKISLLVFREKIDLVYSNSIQSHIYAILVRVFTFRTLIWHVRDNIKNRVTSFIFSLFATKVICISQFVFKQVVCNSSKKLVIYNGIDSNLWCKTKHIDSSLRLGLNIGDNVLLVGHIGQLIPWKRNIDLIFVAESVLKSYKNVHFIIIGEDLFNDNPNYTYQLRNLIKEKELDDSFSFLEYQKNIINYFQQLDILIHCADSEPFGRVIMEGMALEKPIVAYDCGGPQELIIHNETGFLVTPFQIDSLSEHLLTLLNDKELRIKFGKQARQEVIRRFSLEESTRAIEAIFDER